MPIIPMPSTAAEWHALRLKHIGASEIPALLDLGADHATSPVALYLIKRGEIPAPDIDSDVMERGRRLEPVMATWACDLEGWTEQPAAYAIDDVCPGMAASMDRIVLPCADEIAAGFVGPGVIEVKTVNYRQWRDKWVGEEPPLYVRLQLQQGLACSGFQWGAVVAGVAGEKPYRWKYRRHEGLIAELRRIISDFWADTRDGRMPEPDARVSTTAAIRALYSQVVEGQQVDLSHDNTLGELCIEDKALAAEEARIKKRREFIKNTLKLRMGTAYKAKVAGGIWISHTIGDDVPDRPAEPGETIKGRRGTDRLTITVPKEIATNIAKDAAA